MSSPKPLSSLLAALTNDVIGKRGVLFGKLLGNWKDIVGAEMAAKALPIELKFAGKADKTKNQATLVLAATSSSAVELQYEIALLKEKLNMFFGYSAIKDIKIIHKTINSRVIKAPSLKTKKIDEQTSRKIDELAINVKEKDLQDALKSLGKAIMIRQ